MEERRRGRERVSRREQLLRERQEREEEARGRALAAVREREERLDRLRQTVSQSSLHIILKRKFNFRWK
ncbi:hypothetical protein GBAR_LOCUS20178 [Geodia barretti]|uniref:Uncharacterized protein n=1 Tax=Geodia barretti TaxID=519541 RepID=A0AA35X2T3_GEOBA|nr:hypothetical protein GBAR_LOCUS20178 [Geodia barretti]